MITQGQIATVSDHPVYDVDRDQIGDIKHVFLDDVTGEPEWVSVMIGLFGTSESLVPRTRPPWWMTTSRFPTPRPPSKTPPKSTSMPGASSRWTRNTASTSTTASRGTKIEAGSRSSTSLTRAEGPAPTPGPSSMPPKVPFALRQHHRFGHRPRRQREFRHRVCTLRQFRSRRRDDAVPGTGARRQGKPRSGAGTAAFVRGARRAAIGTPPGARHHKTSMGATQVSHTDRGDHHDRQHHQRRRRQPA